MQSRNITLDLGGLFGGVLPKLPQERNSIHTTFTSISRQRDANQVLVRTNDSVGTDKDAVRLLGKQRVETMFGRYPYFARAGVSVSIAADVPSTQPSMQAPLFQVEVACTLMVPSEEGNSRPFPPKNKPMSAEQALRAVTIDAAWQLRMDDKVGSLEVGKLADIVVLESNALEVDVMQIEEIDVLMTMMDGDFTYVADPNRPRRRW